jgi:hypothetical protein
MPMPRVSVVVGAERRPPIRRRSGEHVVANGACDDLSKQRPAVARAGERTHSVAGSAA